MTYIYYAFNIFSRAELSIFFGTGLGSGFFLSSSSLELLRKGKVTIFLGYVCTVAVAGLTSGYFNIGLFSLAGVGFNADAVAGLSGSVF